MSDFIGMFKRVIGVQHDDAGEYENEEYDRDGYYERRRQTNYQFEDSKQNHGHQTQERGKVVDLLNDLNLKDMKVAVKKPAHYEDARIICDNLKALNPVVVNLEKLDQNEAQRVVDFIMGACYTMDGHVEEIKEDVFLVAPSLVNIEKEHEEERSSKHNTSFFSKFSF